MRAKILVVDDDILLRDVLYDYLSRQGYEVVAISDPLRAIEKLNRNKFQLAIVDVKMPNLSGLELTKQIKTIDPGTIVFIMTAYPAVSTAINAIKNGAVEFLIKPFKLEELKKLIHNYVDYGYTEKENQFLKQRISELESELQNIGNLPQREIDSTIKKLLNPQVRLMKPYIVNNASTGKKIYQANSLAEVEKNLRGSLEKLDTMLAEGIIEQDEYEKRKQDIIKAKYTIS